MNILLIFFYHLFLIFFFSSFLLFFWFFYFNLELYKLDYRFQLFNQLEKGYRGIEPHDSDLQSNRTTLYITSLYNFIIAFDFLVFLIFYFLFIMIFFSSSFSSDFSFCKLKMKKKMKMKKKIATKELCISTRGYVQAVAKYAKLYVTRWHKPSLLSISLLNLFYFKCKIRSYSRNFV